MRPPLEVPGFGARLQWTGKAAFVAAPEGASILAPAAGVVERAWRSDSHGYAVRVRHRDGNVTVFAHLGGPALVRAGERVQSGQILGRVGKTGAHGYALEWHLVRPGPKRDHYLDPRAFFESDAGKWSIVAFFIACVTGLIWVWPDPPTRR